VLGDGTWVRASPPFTATLAIKAVGATGFRSAASGTNIIASTMDNAQ